LNASSVDGLAGKDGVINLDLFLQVEEKEMFKRMGSEEAMMGN